MHKTINVWALISVLACILIAFFCYSSSLNRTIDELNDTYDASKIRLTELQAQQVSLESTLKKVGSDSFIENQARTMYGYMMPDEIRLVITNPEVLYGEQGVPAH